MSYARISQIYTKTYCSLRSCGSPSRPSGLCGRDYENDFYGLAHNQAQDMVDLLEEVNLCG